MPFCYYIQCYQLFICTFVTRHMSFQYKGNLSWFRKVKKYRQRRRGRNNSYLVSLMGELFFSCSIFAELFLTKWSVCREMINFLALNGKCIMIHSFVFVFFGKGTCKVATKEHRKAHPPKIKQKEMYRGLQHK